DTLCGMSRPNPLAPSKKRHQGPRTVDTRRLRIRPAARVQIERALVNYDATKEAYDDTRPSHAAETLRRMLKCLAEARAAFDRLRIWKFEDVIDPDEIYKLLAAPETELTKVLAEVNTRSSMGRPKLTARDGLITELTRIFDRYAVDDDSP